MRTNKAIRGRKKRSKTDMIAEIFNSRPMEKHSPKEIAGELGLEIQLVTSIVSRLRNEGLIERVGWGQYKLKMAHTIEDLHMKEICDHMKEMASPVMGTTLPTSGELEKEDAYSELIVIYRSIREKGGEIMAVNLLRLCASKVLDDDNVDHLLINIGEVA